MIPGANPSPVGPFPDKPGRCADLDTCDYNFNSGYVNTGVCVPGSVNYDSTSPTIAKDGTPIHTDRVNTCTANPTYCSPYSYWCCKVKEVACTDNAEIISYYDGSAPNFNLFQEGNVNGGITLTYAPAMNYVCFPLLRQKTLKLSHTYQFYHQTPPTIPSYLTLHLLGRRPIRLRRHRPWHRIALPAFSFNSSFLRLQCQWS